MGAAGAGKEARLSEQREQGSLPKSLNTPVVASVFTTVEYLVLVLIEQAVIGLQSQPTKSYSVASSPMVITTGAVIVVSAGMAYATTIQYLHPSPYTPSGMLIVKVPSAKVTALEIIKLLHSRFTFGQLNTLTSLKEVAPKRHSRKSR